MRRKSSNQKDRSRLPPTRQDSLDTLLQNSHPIFEMNAWTEKKTKWRQDPIPGGKNFSQSCPNTQCLIQRAHSVDDIRCSLFSQLLEIYPRSITFASLAQMRLTGNKSSTHQFVKEERSKRYLMEKSGMVSQRRVKRYS